MSNWKQDNFVISADKEKLDVDVIYTFLSNSYWASTRSLEQIVESIKNSFCFGVYDIDKQIGFARVITDYSTFAYLAYVFILSSYQGKGLGKWLIDVIFSTEELATLFHFPLRVSGMVGPTMEKVESKKAGPPPNLPVEE